MQACKSVYECRRDKIIAYIVSVSRTALDAGDEPNWHTFEYLREWTRMSKEAINRLEAIHDQNELLFRTVEGNAPCPHCLAKGIRRLNANFKLVKSGKITVVPEIKKRPCPQLA